jgi:hypothetical protein
MRSHDVVRSLARDLILKGSQSDTYRGSEERTIESLSGRVIDGNDYETHVITPLKKASEFAGL